MICHVQTGSCTSETGLTMTVVVFCAPEQLGVEHHFLYRLAANYARGDCMKHKRLQSIVPVGSMVP